MGRLEKTIRLCPLQQLIVFVILSQGKNPYLVISSFILQELGKNVNGMTVRKTLVHIQLTVKVLIFSNSILDIEM